ncbi:MAG: DNA polymerase III subunit beta [Firmicutes bacterium]|nr:DNA polymerase III subunit beta [Bacillota bacterium]
MRFTIDKSILLEALNNVVKALSQKITIPVLNGIVIEVNSNGLELLASDSELTIKVNIDKKEIKNIEKEGKIVIQSRYILDIIRKMPTDLIYFESIDNNNVKIYSDINEFVLNCYNLSDYPNISIDTSANVINLEASLLRQIINQTSYAMSTQEVRPLLTGINIKINGDILECIATDSYRLAKKVIKLSTPIEESINIVIPGKSVNELVSILKDEDNVEIHLFNNKILFIYKNIMFQSTLLNGTYPDTTNYIPKDFEYMINLNLKEYYDAIDRASIITLSKDKNIVKMCIDDKKMTIFGSSAESGKTKEELTIESNNKERLDISFSSKYMMDALKVLNTTNIILLINSDDKPIIINAVDDDTIIELILPIKTY